ncbi:MAG TPA: hypothetical protein VJT49_04570 [Amycolatopsis sp.]|uniref:hypothetical protein n=1 Tax=Amycolatopsis sp. TaxID=37632 RepID=UPI002B485BCD|nr:hypothetical protein [Amycolatopsis sp.]HKS44383.1 hypothetical protein [Amycolatopsis sp.]
MFDRKEKDLVHPRADIGGTYRWKASIGRWIPLLGWVGWQNWRYNGVVSLPTDDVDPNRVHAGVGMYTIGWDPGNGAILRSTERGNTWQSTVLPVKLGGNGPGHGRTAGGRSEQQQRAVLRGAERERPVAQHRRRRQLDEDLGLGKPSQPHLDLGLGKPSQPHLDLGLGKPSQPHLPIHRTSRPRLAELRHEPSPPEVTPKLGWLTEAMKIDPFDSNHLLYRRGPPFTAPRT